MAASPNQSSFWRRYLWPRRLLAQMALVIALSLTAAQVMNVYLLLNEQQLGQLARSRSLAESFCGEAIAELFSASSEQAAAWAGRMSNNPLMSLEWVSPSLRGVQDLTRNYPLEERIVGDMLRRGVSIASIEAGDRPVRHRMIAQDTRRNQRPPPPGAERFQPGPQQPGMREQPPQRMREQPQQGMREQPPPLRAAPNIAPNAEPMETFIAVRQQPRGEWLRCRVISPPEDRSINMRLILGTLTLYVIVLSSLLLLTRWLVTPLSRLAAAAEQMGSGERVSHVPTDGPQEVTAVAEAFNEMNARITRVLMDKDAMLGAIGHDLRTPLTSLRIRAENLEQSRERDRMIESIEHLARILDGILELSRIGVDKETPVLTDVTALIMTIVEEFEDFGVDVKLLSSARSQAVLRPHLFMRLLRNLIENAVKYGLRARVSVEALPDALAIQIDDDGPGFPAGAVDRLMKPFERLDMSRNSTIGGSGLGLSIAKMIADVHRASLDFRNRGEGGLRVSIRLPHSDAKP